MRWYIEFKRIEYQNRTAKCIIQGNDIVMEVDNYNDMFVNSLVNMHNSAVSKAYKDGLLEGVKITKEELRGE